jgi:hypothetical protein
MPEPTIILVLALVSMLAVGGLALGWWQEHRSVVQLARDAEQEISRQRALRKEAEQAVARSLAEVVKLRTESDRVVQHVGVWQTEARERREHAEHLDAEVAEQRKRYEQEVSTLAHRIGELERGGFVECRHRVILDGMPKSGKTTFVERVTNPLVTREQLAQLPATRAPRLYPPVPVCWEVVQGRRTLHTIEFHDIAGERPANVIDVLYALDRGRRDLEALTMGRAAVLVVWDAGADRSSNREHLPRPRVEAVYGSEVAQRHLQGIVIFLNKCDQLGSDASDAAIGQISDIEGQVFGPVRRFYEHFHIERGSALTGEGVHACTGALLRVLGLSHLYQSQADPHPSRQSVQQTAQMTRAVVNRLRPTGK